MSERLDWQGYPCSSRRIHDDAWFYVEKKGLCVVIDKSNGATTATIRWASIEAALKARKRAVGMKKRSKP